MNCVTARASIDTHANSRVLPDNVRFHLASCASCRAYRAARVSSMIDDTALLGQLLSESIDTAPSTAGQPVLPTLPDSKAVGKRRSAARTALNMFLIGSAVALVLIIGTVTLAAAMIHRNIQAMIVPTAVLPVRLPTAQATIPIVAALPTQQHAAPTTTPSPLPVSSPSPTALPQLAAQAPSLPTLLPTTQIPYPPSTNAINILVVGSDRRPDDEGDTRADTVMLVRVDPQRQRIALLSLPRDLIVPIPGYGQARINAANAYGGVGLVRSTVSELLGVPIDYYVTVNFDGFIAVVDAVGGIDVNVETELYDPEYPTMDYGYTEAHFLPGMQHMDGATALMYSRIRHPDSDYNRMKRQQQVVLAVGTALQQQNALQSIQSLVTMSGALRGYIQTDMPEDTMLGLAWSLHSLSPDGVERYTLGADQVTENVIPGDPYASFALPGAIQALVQQFIGPQ